MTDRDLAVLNKMERCGGSFVKALARAARYADPENLQRIKTTWPEYWRKYDDLSRPYPLPDERSEQ